MTLALSNTLAALVQLNFPSFRRVALKLSRKTCDMRKSLVIDGVVVAAVMQI